MAHPLQGQLSGEVSAYPGRLKLWLAKSIQHTKVIVPVHDEVEPIVARAKGDSETHLTYLRPPQACRYRYIHHQNHGGRAHP